jgi:hypothetical protein
MQRKVDFASLDWLDSVLFSAAPVLSHASLMAGAAGLIAQTAFATTLLRARLRHRGRYHAIAFSRHLRRLDTHVVESKT